MGSASSTQAFVVNNNVAIPLITGIVNINSDTTINDSHFGKLLLVDTSDNNNVYLTLSSNVTIANFTFAVQKIYSMGEVSFLSDGTNAIYAATLTDFNQGIRLYKIGINWHGF